MTFKRMSMIIAHIGLAITFLGIVLNKSYSEERQIKISPHETATFAGYQVTFDRTEKLSTKNYTGLKALFTFSHPKKIITIAPEERIYRSHEQVFSKPGITYNAFRDLYIALGNEYSDGSWTVRLYYKPFVRWIWVGGFFILLGGCFSFFYYIIQRVSSYASL
jgi:cytochrome c-type biogenesis protein CcmF